MMTTTRYLLPGSLVAGTRPIDRLFEQFLGYEAAIREDARRPTLFRSTSSKRKTPTSSTPLSLAFRRIVSR